jgi:alkaline phosphatase D
MLLLGTLTSAALLITGATAGFDGNLNYASPSRRHTNLGIDVPLVQRRSMKRGNVAFQPSELNFTHGVASGDPWAKSVVLWTRIAPSMASESSSVPVEGLVPMYDHETKEDIKADPNPICLDWKIWDIEDESVVTSGKAYTTSDIDYTVKVRSPEMDRHRKR